MKGILIRLRTRHAKTSLGWVKGHAEDYRNNRADALANTGRENDSIVRMDEEDWLNSHPALQDRAQIQALEAKHVYNILIERFMQKTTPVRHQLTLEDAKDKVQEVTGLCPINEKLLKGISPSESLPDSRTI